MRLRMTKLPWKFDLETMLKSDDRFNYSVYTVWKIEVFQRQTDGSCMWQKTGVIANRVLFPSVQLLRVNFDVANV